VQFRRVDVRPQEAEVLDLVRFRRLAMPVATSDSALHYWEQLLED
jgi:hypothetical protein